MKKIIFGACLVVALAFAIGIAQAGNDETIEGKCGFDTDDVCCVSGSECGCMK